MGCGSSREVGAESQPAAVPANVAPSTRSTHAAGITSQTAINAPPSPIDSRHQSSRYRPSGPDTSSSNISTSQRDLSLHEHYNTPLARPKPWSSTERTWTRTQLRRERDNFFDAETSIAGRVEIWGALKEVCELIRRGDMTDAQGILDAAGITTPTGHLEQGSYDETGKLYKLPQHIVSDPLNVLDDDEATVVGGDGILTKKFEAGSTLPLTSNQTTTINDNPTDQEKQDKGKDPIDKDAMKVRCRLSDRGGPDTIVLLGQSQPVSVLVRRLRSEATIASSSRVRIVYFGKILEEAASLEHQGWQQGHVVQALVSNFAP